MGNVVCWVTLYIFIQSLLLIQSTLLRAREDKGYIGLCPYPAAAYCPIKGDEMYTDNYAYKEPCEKCHVSHMDKREYKGFFCVCFPSVFLFFFFCFVFVLRERERKY